MKFSDSVGLNFLVLILKTSFLLVTNVQIAPLLPSRNYVCYHSLFLTGILCVCLISRTRIEEINLLQYKAFSRNWRLLWGNFHYGVNDIS